jgi:hypothetical protein
VPCHAAAQEEPEAIVVEVAKAMADPADLFDGQVHRLGGAVRQTGGVVGEHFGLPGGDGLGQPVDLGDVDLATVPTEVQYFHAAAEEWVPGVAVVERLPPGTSPNWLHFPGQMQPLNIPWLDYGTEAWAELRYKTDFYDEATIAGVAAGLERLLAAVVDHPGLHLSQLPAAGG